jgi:hypothetical protein
MSETAFLFATLAALLAAKGFALIAVDQGRSDGLPLPDKIDRSRSSRRDLNRVYFGKRSFSSSGSSRSLTQRRSAMVQGS